MLALNTPQLSTLRKPAETRSQPQRTRWLRFNLRLLLLLTAVIAVWTAVVTNYLAIRPLSRKVQELHPFAGELLVEDPAQAAVNLKSRLLGEEEWDIYLPPGYYKIVLATQNIDRTGLAPSDLYAPLQGGKFNLVLTQRRSSEGWELRVTKDGEQILGWIEPSEWSEFASFLHEEELLRTGQHNPSKPLVLLRRKFHLINPQSGQSVTTTAPAGPGPGVQLWIEPAMNGP
jgi:hypothetical protein